MLWNVLTVCVLKSPELCPDILLSVFPFPPFLLCTGLCKGAVTGLVCSPAWDGNRLPAGVGVSPHHLHLLLPDTGGGMPWWDFVISAPFARPWRSHEHQEEGVQKRPSESHLVLATEHPVASTGVHNQTHTGCHTPGDLGALGTVSPR